jgi:hypothetical protein
MKVIKLLAASVDAYSTAPMLNKELKTKKEVG